MIEIFRCFNGHNWRPSAADAGSPDTMTCPVCGARAETRLSVSPEATTYVVPTEKLTPSPDASTEDLAATWKERRPRRASQRLPVFPGYEILGELGRGGMGMVFKARQTALDRIVAIKTISEAALSDPRSRRRFRIEVKAIAQLNHPHIAQIYEVDEHEGVPYFVMEFVDGESIAEQIKEHSPSPVEAARLLEKVARAVAFAHQLGVIHRDLKPGNVLLTADGTPKITDFGLAKRLDRESSQTHTGSVLGTPNYMSPEQAEGRTRIIGPASDVYGLGAVLYDLLCRRPPFLGAAAMDTLRQVIEDEPPRPRLLNPEVPRDLETICLKCLEKIPAQRYASADSLADDLRRYLAGEPIEARPVGAAGRTWRWCRRKPWIACLSAATVALFLVALLASTLGYFSTSAALSDSRAAGEEARRSEANAQRSYLDALDAVNEFYGLVGGDMLLQAERDALPVREQLLQRGVDYYSRLLKDRDGYLMRRAAVDRRQDIVLSDKIGDSWNTFGRVLFHLNDPAAAAGAFSEATAIREELAREHPQEQKYQRQLANSQMNLGIVNFTTGNLDETRSRFEIAHSIRERLAEKDDDPELSGELAMGLYNLGKLSFALGEPDSAREQLLLAVSRYEQLYEGDPDDTHTRYRLGLCCETLGDLETTISAALDRYVVARGHLERIVHDRPGVAEYQVELARVLIKTGELYLQQDRRPQSLRALLQAEAILQELVDRVPDSPRLVEMLAGTRKSIEIVQQHSGQDASSASVP